MSRAEQYKYYLRPQRVRRSIPEDSAIVFWDVQTLGLATDDRITELGSYELVSGQTFHSLVNPNSPVRDTAPPITMDTRILEDQPTFQVIGPKFMDWLDCLGKEVFLVSRNASFNEYILKQEAQVQPHN